MHIMSDEQYNRLMAMKAYLEDPAPLPMWDEEDEDLRAAVNGTEFDKEIYEK